LGLTDDAAVLAPPPGRELVFTVDQMIENVHFLPGDAPGLIARKLLRRNLSDLAAMGAAPLGYLLTTALPKQVDDAWLRKFAEGLQADQREFGLALFGGDSSSSITHASFSATLIGHIAPGTALRRNGAKPGDECWVTGTIGDAALGLRARLGKLEDKTGFLTSRSLLPSPRLGLELAGIVHAAIDISDGLVQDLAHICTESRVGAVLQTELVPASEAAAAFGEAMLEARLTDGDDYELLLAVPPQNAAAVKTACGNLRLTRIGHLIEGAGVALCYAGDDRMTFSKPGWTHF
jgi:thiamine-monophosphate kinase